MVCCAISACSFDAPPPYFSAAAPSGPQVPVFCYQTLADADCYPTPQPGQENRFTAVYQKDVLDKSSLEYWTSPETDELGNPIGPPRYRRVVTPAGKPINVPAAAAAARQQSYRSVPASVPIADPTATKMQNRPGRIGTASLDAYTARSASPYALTTQQNVAGAASTSIETFPLSGTPIPAQPSPMPPASTASATQPRSLFIR
ncbi:hypothetical protein SAMN07250955_101469 [Arboricoccus pini]|uniref:Uncharacterized protein n=2 Tax=Arboricoccus pini TaxID=1963835 RepID=A0A212Q7K3_9PROT|nr:hypothetical protein SAMN07250955_101469 [Arboricoccus pini]